MARDTLKGICAHYNKRNTNGDLFLAGAFTACLEDFGKGALSVPLLDSHRWWESDRVIGGVSVLAANKTRVRFEALWGRTSLARDLQMNVEDRFIRGVSIGFSVEEHTFTDHGRNIAQAEIREISVVTFPADTRALIDSSEPNVAGLHVLPPVEIPTGVRLARAA